MDTDVASLLWFVVPGFVLPGVLLFLAFRSPSWKQMTRWATQAQVTITTDNEDMIRRRLGRARRYRSLLSAPFWWVFALPTITQARLPGWLERAIWIPLTGYVLGSMLAAVARPNVADGVRTADLSPRLPSRYTSPRYRLAPWVLLSSALAMFGLTRVFPPRYPVSLRAEVPLFLTATAVAVLAEAALRLIATQTQMAGSPSRRAADDALRSSGATAAVASSIMLSLMTLNSALTGLLVSGQRAWVGVPAMLLVTGMTLGIFWEIVTQQPWAPVWRRPLSREPEPQLSTPPDAVGA